MKLKYLKKGVTRCPNCGIEINLNIYPPLTLASCPSCEEMVPFPLKIKDYWLYKPLGAGGEGCVWVGFNEKFLYKKYAIKVLQEAGKQNGHMLHALKREGEAGIAIGKHKNIVNVIEFGNDRNEWYIITEYVPSERLDTLIDRYGPFPVKHALDVIQQIIEAEEHICSKGYLFRDLKPENIIITPNGQVKLLDFGLCLKLDVANSDYNVKTLEGSPHYMPPERIAGTAEGEYSEVYSIGMLLYHMLTGKTLFTRADAEKLMIKHVNAIRLPSIGNRITNCDKKTVTMIDKMIYRNPNARYHTIKELKLAVKKASLRNISLYPQSLALFINPKRRVRFYTFWSITLGVTAIILLFILYLFFIG